MLDTHLIQGEVDVMIKVGPRRIGFYRNRISTGNQNHHSVSGSPEPDFLKIRFRSGRTGFQNLTGFRPDFIIWLDYYRISKFSRIPTGIQKFWQCLSLEGGKEWDVSWFIEVTLTHKRISIRSLGGRAANHVLLIQLSIIQRFADLIILPFLPYWVSF